MTSEPRARKRRAWLGRALFAVCALAVLAPLFAARDVPLVDLPSHLAVIDVWNHANTADAVERGYTQYYDLHIQLAPYWVFYGFVHYASAVMPIRWAAKLFIAFTLLGIPFGLLAFLRAVRGPPVLALAGFVLAWNGDLTWGFVAYAAGMGASLYAYALLARLDDARPWPSRRLWAANIAMGFFLAFTHPLAYLLWIPGLVVYARRRLPIIILPSLAVMALAFLHARSIQKPDPRFYIAGIWRSLGDNLRHFESLILGPVSDTMRVVTLGTLAFALVATAILARRASPRRDWRPAILFGLVCIAYLGLPLHLEMPVGFAEMNSRLPVFIVLVAFGLWPERELPGWRELVIGVPLAAMATVYSITITQDTAAFGARERDFYALVDRLPMNPRVLTLMWRADDSWPRHHLWHKFAAYVQLERGGYDPVLWDQTQGIGEIAFPAGYKEGVPRPPGPPPESPHLLDWTTQAPSYDYFLTQWQPGDWPAAKNGLTFIAKSGPWQLWQRVGPSGTSPTSAPARAEGH